MNLPENLKLNRTQALGLFFLVISAFTYLGGWAWVMAYWDTEPVESYRGFEIYYFPNINVYGVDTGGEPDTWRYNAGLQGARNMIDSWLDTPELIETYRDWTIYKMGGYGLYYGVNGDQTTNNWSNLTKLEAYIDAEFYPTLVYTMHRDSGDYLIYRQGMDHIRYWVEYDGDILEYFKTQTEAQQYVYDLLDPEEAEEIEEQQGESEIPDTDNDEAPDPEGQSTLGDLIEAQKLVITAVSGFMGLGLVALGSVRREL